MIDKLFGKSEKSPLPPDPLNFLVQFQKSVETLDMVIREADARIRGVDAMLRSPFGMVTPPVTSPATSPEKEEEREEETISNLKRRVLSALREIQTAKTEVSCPHIQNILEEIELFTEEKLEDLIETAGGKKLLETTEKVLEEEGVKDWTSLDEKRKEEIKRKIKRRMKEGM